MKIFDCFLFFNELELLELRFETLWDVVDKFVIVEANRTFRGQPKEFNFEKNKDKFEKYLSKIVYEKVYDSPEPINKYYCWNVEFFQRNCIMRALNKHADRDDYILVSDADEILNPYTLINSLVNKRLSFEQELYYYFINLKQNKNFVGPVLARYGSFNTAEQLRHYRHKNEIVKNGGWHFSFLGGVNRIIEKMNAFAEVAFTNEINSNVIFLLSKIYNKEDIFNRKDIKFEVIKDYSKLPKYIYQLIKKYPYIEYKPDNVEKINTNEISISNFKLLRKYIRNVTIRGIAKIFDLFVLKKFIS